MFASAGKEAPTAATRLSQASSSEHFAGFVFVRSDHADHDVSTFSCLPLGVCSDAACTSSGTGAAIRGIGSYNAGMRVARGKVVGNTVVLDDPLPEGKSLEGTAVTVYLEEDGWVLDEAGTKELLEAIAEADRGEVISADEVFARLPPRK